MTLIHSIILGIVEGLTEFLPISSTGHMVLVSHFLKVENAATLATFEVVVQVGAIGAVILLFFKKLLQLNLAKKLAVAFIPTGIVGVIVYPFIKSWLQNPILVAVMLVIGGICILLVERWYEKKLDDGDVEIVHDLTYRQALLLGVYQALAVVPGVSRSGA
jgi:undecaprenyl-diphosphatase